MHIYTLEQQRQAMTAIIQALDAQGVDLQAIAEAAKLRILGSSELFSMPADFRVRSASAVDQLILDAATDAQPLTHLP